MCVRKTGRRLRDRTEWIAIPLPKKLRLVPSEMFERVQVQLQRNRAFSPRNGNFSTCFASFAGFADAAAAHSWERLTTGGGFTVAAIGTAFPLPQPSVVRQS